MALLNAPIAACPPLRSFSGTKKIPLLRRRRLTRYAPLHCAAGELLNFVDEAGNEDAVGLASELLACPICFTVLTRKGPPGLNQLSISRSAFQCPTCKRTFSSRDVYLDLTVFSGSRGYEEVPPGGTELFRNPLVSLVYERGWRENFGRQGFPGPDEELEMALAFLKPTYGGVLLDLSCGSGLFTRRFAKSGKYVATIALDFSESMLRQCSEFIKQDRSLRNENIALVRADVSRLPFASGTMDAVHAGAALHCWPSPAAGVAEICRVLKPGGVFVGTTFLITEAFSLLPMVSGRRNTGSMRYWKEAELEELCRICGLSGYEKIRKGSFIMLAARKIID